jgi:hypothetical protein
MSKCKSCGAEIEWMKTKNGKNIPVDVETYHGEKTFDPSKHQTHFITCPNAEEHRKNKEGKQP